MRTAAAKASLICWPYVVAKATTHKDSWVITQALQPLAFEFRKRAKIFVRGEIQSQTSGICYGPIGVAHYFSETRKLFSSVNPREISLTASASEWEFLCLPRNPVSVAFDFFQSREFKTR
jgi:hypothetical protein